MTNIPLEGDSNPCHELNESPPPPPMGTREVKVRSKKLQVRSLFISQKKILCLYQIETQTDLTKWEARQHLCDNFTRWYFIYVHHHYAELYAQSEPFARYGPLIKHSTYPVASKLNDPICHSDECQIGSFSSEATIRFHAVYSKLG